MLNKINNEKKHNSDERLKDFMQLQNHNDTQNRLL